MQRHSRKGRIEHIIVTQYFRYEEPVYKPVEPQKHQRGLTKIMAVQGIMTVDEDQFGFRLLTKMSRRT